MKYTKWVLEPDSLGKYGVHNIVTATGELITSLPPGGQANAQLIASAPDLYEALKKIIKSGVVYQGQGFDDAFEALAKAEGK